VTLNLFRDGKNMEVSFPIGTQPDSREAPSLASANPQRPNRADSAALGVTVQSLNDTLAKRYGLEAGQGVVVTEVQPDSLAATVGLRSGDVITRVGAEDVRSAEDLTNALSKAKLNEGVRMTVRTADGTERLVFARKG
jgi:S1-C subfamily serine protease